MNRLRRGVIAALAATVLCATAAGTAQADPLEIATQDDNVLFYRKHLDAGAGFDRMRELGVDYLRVNVNWVYALHPSQWRSRSAPRRPRWDFNYTDRIVNDARARGIKLQFTLTGAAPAWATSDRRIGVRRPSPTHFGRFARAFAARYRGRVDRWSIWNEPNTPGWLSPQASCRTRPGSGFVRVRGKRRRRQIKTCRSLSPAHYRQLYRAGYGAIKGVSRANKVWIGELAPTGREFRTDNQLAPRKFLREVLCVDSRYRRRGCAGFRADGVAHHPYPLSPRRQESPRWRGGSTQDVTIASYSRLRLDLRRYHRLGALRTPGGRLPNVYYTEMGFQTGGTRAVSEETQAAYLRESLAMARRQPGVKQYLFYTLYDEAPGRKWIAGLLRLDGSPKPGFASMLDAIRAGRHR